MRALIFASPFVLAALGLCVACSSGSSGVSGSQPDAGSEDAGGVDAGPDADAVMGGNTLSLAASPALIAVIAGGTSDVTVTRAGSMGVDVTLSVSGLPTGVTAMPATIAAGKTTGTITLVATIAAQPAAAPTTATISGTSQFGKATTTTKVSIHGASGTLDKSWGTNGVSAGLGETGTQATGIGFQKNGLPVIGGYVGMQYAVARYTNAGVLDPTFGTAGKTYVAISGANTKAAFANSLVVDANDLIYQAGSMNGGASVGQSVRYLSTGMPDSAWGTSGVAGMASGALIHALELDSTGKLLVAGADQINSGCTYRFTATGGNDTSWGINVGSSYCVTTGVNTTVYAPQALGLQSKGRVIAAGTAKPPGQPSTSAFIAGISSTGSVDTNFGTTGYTLTTAKQWFALAIGSDDTILAAGYEQPDNQTKMSVARFSVTGTLDTTFNDTGIATFTVGDSVESSTVNGLAIQKDGKVLLVGNAVSGGRSVMAVLRLDNKGVLDKSFGPNGGMVLLPVATATAGANAVAVGPDGMIYVVGHGDMDFAVARFWP